MTERSEFAAYQSRRVTYPSEGADLGGYFLIPTGDPPFPGLVFSHGSDGLSEDCFRGIEILVNSGYAVLAATRRGYNGNPGLSWHESVLSATSDDKPLFAALGDKFVETLQTETRDACAALEWLAARPEIDAGRLGAVGQSFGGVITLFLAARSKTIRAGVSFAGPSITWPHVPALQEAMLAAVRAANPPLFFIQAQNDHSLAPTYTLAADLARCGKPHEVRVYPQHGVTAMDGHGLFRTGTDWWRDDVRRFLGRSLT